MTQEFTVIWFESTMKWLAVLDDGTVLGLAENFGGVQRAVNAALTTIGCGESDFDCVQNDGDFMRYRRAVATE